MKSGLVLIKSMGISLLIATETGLDPALFRRLLHGLEPTKIASENEWLTGITISKIKPQQERQNEHKNRVNMKGGTTQTH